MIIVKPWGQEEILEVNDFYVVKRLTMNEGHRCSLQYHEVKRETIYVLEGTLRITSGSSTSELSDHDFIAGQSITLEPNVIHRMQAITTSVYLEASTPELDDVVRLSDDYFRD